MNRIIRKPEYQMPRADWEEAGDCVIRQHRRTPRRLLNDDQWTVLCNSERGYKYMRSLKQPAIEEFYDTPVCEIDESAYVDDDLMGGDYLNALEQ